MQIDDSKNPRIGQTCSRCSNKITSSQSQRDFATVLQKGNSENYKCFCLKCLNLQDPDSLQIRLAPQQLTKHPDQFISEVKKEVDYPQDQEESKTTNSYACQLQSGYQLVCKKHNEVLNLWDKKANRLACIKCAQAENVIRFGDDGFIFLEQQIENVVKNIDRQINELDRAIDHYKQQEERIENAKDEQIKKDNQCKEDIRKFIEGECKDGINNYIIKKKGELDKLDSKIGQYSEEIETRGRILRDRGNSIKQFSNNFKNRNALYLKMDPISLFKEDITFWSNINKNWDSKNFNWSYKTPSFQFVDPEKVAQDIFKVDYVQSQKKLRIVDFRS